MADLYVKAPKIMKDDPDDPTTSGRTTSVSNVTGITLENNGFNAGDTEGLVHILNPSAGKKTEILALTDVVELTEAEWEAEKPNYPN